MGDTHGHDRGGFMMEITEKRPIPLQLRDFGSTPMEYHSKRLYLKAALKLAITGTHRDLTKNEKIALVEMLEKAL